MKEYENLVFEGGGPRAITAHAGALVELQKYIDFSKVKRVAGTSAGAVIAFLLAIGYSPEEITAKVMEIDYMIFRERRKNVVRHAMESIYQLGWFDGKVVRKTLTDFLYEKTGTRELGFVQLSRFPDTKKLFVVCTDALNGRVEVFNENQSADIVDIVMASAAIPLLFRPVRWSNTYLTDGGVALNYPIRQFDGGGVNEKTLGFRVDSTSEINEIQEYRNLAEMEPDADEPLNLNIRPWQIRKLSRIGLRYVGGIISLMHRRANRAHLNANDWNRTVFINDKGYAANDFTLSRKDKEGLMESGAIGVREYFKWLNSTTNEKV